MPANACCCGSSPPPIPGKFYQARLCDDDSLIDVWFGPISSPYPPLGAFRLSEGDFTDLCIYLDFTTPYDEAGGTLYDNSQVSNSYPLGCASCAADNRNPCEDACCQSAFIKYVYQTPGFTITDGLITDFDGVTQYTNDAISCPYPMPVTKVSGRWDIALPVASHVAVVESDDADLECPPMFVHARDGYYTASDTSSSGLTLINIHCEGVSYDVPPSTITVANLQGVLVNSASGAKDTGLGDWDGTVILASVSSGLYQYFSVGGDVGTKVNIQMADSSWIQGIVSVRIYIIGPAPSRSVSVNSVSFGTIIYDDSSAPFWYSDVSFSFRTTEWEPAAEYVGLGV